MINVQDFPRYKTMQIAFLDLGTKLKSLMHKIVL